MKPSKYTQRHCEPIALKICQSLKNEVNDKWDHVLGIPLCGETEMISSCIEGIREAIESSQKRYLIILLVNEAADTSPDYKLDNVKLLKFLNYAFPQPHNRGEDWSFFCQTNIGWLTVDQTGKRCFPEKQGVGLARKILGDIAVLLREWGLLNCSWMHQTDADARLPRDYFHQLNQIPDVDRYGAIIHQFAHIPSSDHNPSNREDWLALVHYEIWLRYYQLGLHYAGSPYAFFTIGSLIAFNLHYYALAHGFPKRNAAEDFYFLNKISKLAPIYTHKGSPIQLVHRPSMRVPFGTGRGSADYSEKLRKQRSICTYHPTVFTGLKMILSCVEDALINDKVDRLDEFLIDSFSSYAQRSSQNIQASEIFTDTLNVELLQKSCHEAQKRAGSKNQAFQQFHVWFDAFRTLKAIHHLRDRCFGELPLLQAVKEAKLVCNEVQTPEDILCQLRNLSKA